MATQLLQDRTVDSFRLTVALLSVVIFSCMIRIVFLRIEDSRIHISFILKILEDFYWKKIVSLVFVRGGE